MLYVIIYICNIYIQYSLHKNEETQGTNTKNCVLLRIQHVPVGYIYIYKLYIYIHPWRQNPFCVACSHISCVSYVLHGFRKVILPVIVCIIPIFAQLFHWLQSPFQRVPATYVRQSSSILRVSEGTEHR